MRYYSLGSPFLRPLLEQSSTCCLVDIYMRIQVEFITLLEVLMESRM